MAYKYSWFTQLLIAIDQLFNVIFRGWADETISARSWRRREKLYFRYSNDMFGISFICNGFRLMGVMRVIIDSIFLDNTHCKRAYESEKAHNHLPPELRGLDD